MPDISGTWTNATQIAVVVYRGALAPVASVNDGYTTQGNIGSTVIGYRALTPSTRPASSGTGWFAAFATHKTATNAATAPTGMTNIASGGTTAVVHDTGAPVSVAWPLTNVTVNASGVWTESTVQISASGTVSRVGAAAGSGTSIAIPAGHLIGDLIVIHAANDSSSTAVTAGAGFTSLTSSSGTNYAYNLGYKIATVSDTVVKGGFLSFT
jgi:hypothetical protein